jgi:hypothetical protein
MAKRPDPKRFVTFDDGTAGGYDFVVDTRTEEQKKGDAEWAKSRGGCDDFEPDWDAIERAANEQGNNPKLVAYRKKDDSPTLEEAQKFIGGYIEIVHTKTGAQLIIDETGSLKGLPTNEMASRLYGGVIVGPAIILIEKAKWT